MQDLFESDEELIEVALDRGAPALFFPEVEDAFACQEAFEQCHAGRIQFVRFVGHLDEQGIFAAHHNVVAYARHVAVDPFEGVSRVHISASLR